MPQTEFRLTKDIDSSIHITIMNAPTITTSPSYLSAKYSAAASSNALSSLNFPSPRLQGAHKNPRGLPDAWQWSRLGVSMPNGVLQMAQAPFCFDNICSASCAVTPYLRSNSLALIRGLFLSHHFLTCAKAFSGFFFAHVLTPALVQDLHWLRSPSRISLRLLNWSTLFSFLHLEQTLFIAKVPNVIHGFGLLIQQSIQVFNPIAIGQNHDLIISQTGAIQ